MEQKSLFLIFIVAVIFCGIFVFIQKNKIKDNNSLNQEQAKTEEKDKDSKKKLKTEKIIDINNNTINNQVSKQVISTRNKLSSNAKSSSGNSDADNILNTEMPDRLFEYMISAALLFNKQDQYYRNRISYEDISSKTRKLLESKLTDISSKENVVSELLNYARQCEKDYWSMGDLNNPDAYKRCYSAQTAIELALVFSPNDLTLYDELAEVISASHPLEDVAFQEGSPKRETNLSIVKELIDIRSKQLNLYEEKNTSWPQSKKFISPVLKVYMELVYLYNLIDNQQAAAKTAEKAAMFSGRGGWYNLTSTLESYAQGLQTGSKDVLPEEIVNIALDYRFDGVRQKPGWRDSFFDTSKTYLRRSPFFEGPHYLKNINEK